MASSYPDVYCFLINVFVSSEVLAFVCTVLGIGKGQQLVYLREVLEGMFTYRRDSGTEDSPSPQIPLLHFKCPSFGNYRNILYIESL
jgi:hypothetical protein